MNKLLIFVTITALKIFFVDSLNISFISWNVKDNLKFEKYSKDIVSELLQLKSDKKTPDLYAISFQEMCTNCNKQNLYQIASPFIETLQSLKLESYKLLSIYDTRRSSLCETLSCSSLGSMHGTTTIMILAKLDIYVSNMFDERANDCSYRLIANNEKGIAVIGFTLDGVRLCFGGLHLEVENVKSRQKCFAEIFRKTGKCDVLFFGGDFNSRPKDKSHPIPKEFQGGQNESFINEMKRTDELSGEQPFSGNKNLLTYISSIKNMQFFEPLLKAPAFQPTYSIKSSLKCQAYPVCYEPKRFPSWTDRIIFAPSEKVKCNEYNSIPSLGYLSDHIPVYANCYIQ